MYYYKINIENIHYKELFDDIKQFTNESITCNSTILSHDEKFTDSEFYKIIEDTLDEIREVWTEQGIKYQLIKFLLRKGFSKVEIEKEFTYRDFK